ncbi:MAG: hypothetical protein CL949_07350 [Erythrobacter sp.]|nr:hypothetical protein [Erythrobacter sp.]|tara:strand:+ start:5511 stop:5705 length:195 start_codon:yes stop_codon:yes gene_type:complete
MEAGIDHFIVILPDPETGRRLSRSNRVANPLQKEGPVDRVGLDGCGIGRHHQAEFLENRAVAVQ